MIAAEPKMKQQSSLEQRSLLVNFLELHPTIATYKGMSDIAQTSVVKRLWKDLTVELNKLEGAQHAADQWRRVSDPITPLTMSSIIFVCISQIWRDMKHKVKSKVALIASKRMKRICKLSFEEERVAKILSRSDQPSECEIEESSEGTPLSEETAEETIILSEDDSDEQYNENTPNGLELDTDNNQYADAYEQYLNPSQNQPIDNSDTQEESQMSISKSLQDICQQNAEILQHVRQSYDLMAEDSKRKQAYQSTKLAIYKKKLEYLQVKLEMDKLQSFSNIDI